MFKVLEHVVVQSAISLFTKMQRALFGIAVKQQTGSNRPTNNVSSFDDKVTASTVNLGINSSQTECKADEHSSKKWWQNSKSNNCKKLKLQLDRIYSKEEVRIVLNSLMLLRANSINQHTCQTLCCSVQYHAKLLVVQIYIVRASMLEHKPTKTSVLRV